MGHIYINIPVYLISYLTARSKRGDQNPILWLSQQTPYGLECKLESEVTHLVSA